jgi:effector-binding domain-containing protein
MRTIDVEVKTTDAVRIAETTGVARGYGHENMGQVFEERLPVVWGRVAEAGLEPGPCVAYYDWPDAGGSVTVHLGFDIDDQTLADDEEVHVVELPVVEVASALHRGAMDDIGETFGALMQWVDANGYRIADRSREIYVVWNPDEPASNVTEIQVPITRGRGL